MSDDSGVKEGKFNKYEREVKKLYPQCSDEAGRTSLLQLLFTLSFYSPFKSAATYIGQEMIKIEHSRHKNKDDTFMQCMSPLQGEKSFLSNFLVQLLEYDSVPSKLMR